MPVGGVIQGIPSLTSFDMNKQAADGVRARAVKVMKRLMSETDIRTRVAFAQRVGATYVAINRWENGTGVPTIDNIVNICTEFGVSPDYILLGKGDIYGGLEVSTRIDNIESRLKVLERKAGVKRDT